MGILFDDAASQYLFVNNTPITAAPFTWSCWVQCDADAATFVALFLGDKNFGSEYWALCMRGAQVGDPISQIARTTAGGSVLADTTSGYTVGSWHHICGIETASNNRSALIDGANKGTNASTSAPLGSNRIGVGGFLDSSPSNFFRGTIAEVAIWNVALTEGENSNLAAGWSPRSVRSGNLAAYWRLLNVADLTDVIGSRTLIASGSPATGAHPAILRPGPIAFRVLQQNLGANA